MRRRRRRGLLLSTVLALAGALLITPGTAAASSGPTLPDDAFLSAMTGGNTVGAPIRERAPRADGFRHIDTPAMIERLTELHVTTYTYGIWDMPTDWDDLRFEFAPAAQKAGIDVMVYIVPPSECFLNEQPHLAGRCSRPFKQDYIAWAREIAELSVHYPNVTSWGIDDFLIGDNRELFTNEYLAEVRAAQEAVNPDLNWYVTLYYGQITDEHMAIIDEYLDGVIYPYTGYHNNTIDPTWLQRRLDGALAVTEPAGLDLVLLIYNGRFLDGIIHPDARYAAKMLRRAEPYLADGRISGIISYAAPMQLRHHQPSRDYWAHTGNGSLSLSVSNFVSTVDGSHAAASQRISVNPQAPRQSLSFTHHDWDEGDLTGYQFKQVLVDGHLVWESDIATDPGYTWLDTEIDLTDALAGKKEATLTFRLLHKRGIGSWPQDVRIDDVSGTGFTVDNGGFENTDGWQLARNEPTMQPYIDIFHANRPNRIFNAVAAGYARYQGEAFNPVQSQEWPSLRIGPQNRAFYGNGRLEFTAEENTTIPAGTCASARQEVTVTPDKPRYELDFWHVDQQQASFGKLYKQIRIDGRTVWDRDSGDSWPWFYIQGADHDGVIDVTEFVEGKDSVRLELKVCAKEKVTDAGTTLAFDHLRTIGLDVVNGRFEDATGWTLDSQGPLTTSFDLHGPCQQPDATVISGQHQGPLVVDGLTCVRNATINGAVDVASGASLYLSGSTIRGPVSSDGAAIVVADAATITGPISIADTTEQVRLDHLTVHGPVRLAGNATTPVPIVLTGSEITGPLSCTGNRPAPIDNGRGNAVHGPAGGQCADL